MELIQELLKLNEGKKTYQVKFSHKWEDKELNIRDLETLAKEISMNPSSKEAEQHKWLDLSVLHTLVLDYHGVYSDDARNKNNGIFDAVDEDYEVESFEHDVLKVHYHFTIRYTNENKDPRQVDGVVTLMPGN